MELRDYQLGAVKYGVDFFASAQRGARRVLAGPTGCGKSYVILELQDCLGADCWTVTPRLEIAAGMLTKRGADVSTMAKLVEAAWVHRIVTPVRFLNALTRGEVRGRVSQLLLDEGHHAVSSTWERLQLMCGMPPAMLFTATPYRGTSRGTAHFLSEWGQAQWMVTLREAAERGDVSVPWCEVLPLVDDDVVELNSTGEFDVTRVSSAYSSRLEDLVDASTKWVGGDSKWDRATVFAFPTVQLAKEFAEKLSRRNCPCTCVHAGTPRDQRLLCFEMLVNRFAALSQVSVLGEGVDLPVRRLVDASPKMSPVAWLQQFGRCTRPIGPGEARPQYISTNRNLSRHAYLLEGLCPSAAVVASDLAFGGPSKRGASRALGLEAIGRFRASEVTLENKLVCLFYSLVSVTDGRAREFACLVHPTAPDPVWGERVHGVKADGSRDYGRWRRCESPSDLVGFGSTAPRDVSEKQEAWWKRAAPGRGLDVDAKVTRKNFAVLPFLIDLGLSFRGR